jgi:hypothetical protein
MWSTASYTGAGVAAALSLLGCGELPSDRPVKINASSLSVSAQPPGHDFQDQTQVTLFPSKPANVYYTTDSSAPSDKNGALYQGPITLTASTLLSFIAVSDDGIWSKPVAELYSLMSAPPTVSQAPRLLRVDPDSLVFTVAPIDRDVPQQQQIRIQSFGSSQVTISSIMLDANPKGTAFWDPTAFSLGTIALPLSLAPGEGFELTVGYMPSDSFKSAAIFIQSDENPNAGTRVIELWGRILNW